MTIVLFCFGLVLLVLGGEFLVNGSVSIARRFGMSPLLIGLTLVGFGTSSPELVASVQASLAGSPGIAVGNVVGSNVANLLFILGLTALMCPIAVSDRVVRQDSKFMFWVTALFVAATSLFPLGRLMGAAFVLMLIGYIWYSWHTDRDSSAPEAPIQVPVKGPIVVPLLLALGGLAMVLLGGSLLVDAATTFARSRGISETIIGLTIVAVGTSLPEFATSLIAAWKKQPEVALGNIVGSNIYNILGIAGVTGLIAPTSITDDIRFIYNPVLVAVTLLVVWFLATGRRVTRGEGFILVILFVLYLLSAIVRA